MNKIWVTCFCGNTFESEAIAELDLMMNGEGGKWTKIQCPECKSKYMVKLSINIDDE